MAFNKGKIMRWVTIAIIAMFVVELFIVLTYTNNPAPEDQNQTLAPTPRPLEQFSGVGLAIASVTQLSSKLYATCTPNATTPSEIEQAIAGIPAAANAGLSQATRETDSLYSATASSQTLSDPQKLSETIAELQKALAGKCLENAIILRDGFITPTGGTPCENPFDLNATEYGQQTGLQNQQGTACKNLSFTQVSTYLRNQGLPGIPAFTSWQTAENQSILARISARLTGTQATYLVADELALPPQAPQQEEQPQEPEANQTTQQTLESQTNQTLP